MILSFLFFAFVAYLAFRLVFDFLLPVYRTTKQVRQKFRDMNQQMHRQGSTAPPPPNAQQKDNNQGKKSPLGEYIDFEEVKDK